MNTREVDDMTHRPAPDSKSGFHLRVKLLLLPQAVGPVPSLKAKVPIAAAAAPSALCVFGTTGGAALRRRFVCFRESVPKFSCSRPNLMHDARWAVSLAGAHGGLSLHKGGWGGAARRLSRP